MNKDNKKIVLAGLGLALIFAIVQIKKIKQISIKVKNPDFKKISFNKISLVLPLEINNTSNLTANIKTIDYKITSDGFVLMDNTNNLNKVIEPAQKTIIQLPIEFNPMQLLKRIGTSLFKERNVNIEIKVNANVLRLNWPILVNYKLKI